MGLRRSASTSPYVDWIRSVWLFSDCSKNDIRFVDSVSTRVVVPEGRRLTRQSDRREHFLVIARGTAIATIDKRPFALIEAGSFVGDATALGNGFYRATVTSATHMELLAFSRLESLQ